MLYEEVLEALRPEAGGSYIDATVGSGGHAEGVLERSAPNGRLLGLDADPEALRMAAERMRRFGRRAVLVHRNFAEIGAAAEENGFQNVHGILFDLGVSSMLLEQGERGFSFQRDAPLDMRFDQGQPTTAADLVNKLSLDELTVVLRTYGEEPRARAVARAIVEYSRRPRSASAAAASASARWPTVGGSNEPERRATVRARAGGSQ